MEEQSVIHNTFVIERSYPATPEQVFAAFADPVKKRRWFIEGDHHEVEEFEMDFRVGGMEHTRYLMKEGTPIAGLPLTNDTLYQDMIPNRRIVFASTMALGDKRISASLCTVELLRTKAGTDVVFTHQAGFFEGADGPKMREGGWRQLLESLAKELARAVVRSARESILSSGADKAHASPQS